MTSADTQPDLFISYNREDAEEVEAVARKLVEHGLKVFLDRWSLLPGSRWVGDIPSLLRRSRACAVFIGPSGEGRWQRDECELAVVRANNDPSFRLIPVLLPGGSMPLNFVGLYTAVNLQKGLDDPSAIKSLVDAVREEAHGLGTSERERAVLDAHPPYCGLRPFREEDAAFFFGRERDTELLTEAVRRKPFVAVVGASGSGKSSVVRAGLVPNLRREKPATVWDFARMVPGARPLHRLAAALLPLLEPEATALERLKQVDELAGRLSGDGLALQDVVAHALERQAGSDRLLLVVDQWEELYTLARHEPGRLLFIDALLRATESGPLSVVCTLRGDFYGHAVSHRGLSDRMQGAVVNLGPMSTEELERCIVGPARKVKLSFEPGLVERILEDVGCREPGNLPLLEFALTQLWMRRQGGRLLNTAYDEIGRVSGAIARRAEAECAAFTAEKLELVRRVYTRLVTISRPGEGAKDTRRRATLDEFAGPGGEKENVLSVVTAMADARLLVTSRDLETGKPTVEIAHEALISNWERLKNWLDEDRRFLLGRQRLRAALADWLAAGRDAGTLLPGPLLTEAEGWAQTRPADLSAEELAFIKESAAARRREQSKRVRLRRRIVFGVTGGLLVAAVLSWLAVTFWILAQRQRQTALARQLAAHSEFVRGQSPDHLQRSILLAAESLRRSPTAEADLALRRSLDYLPRSVASFRHDKAVRRLTFGPGGRHLAVDTADNAVEVWEVKANRRVLRVERGIATAAATESEPPAVAFSLKNELVALQGEGQTLAVWELAGARRVSSVSFGADAQLLTFTSDGQRLAAVGDDAAGLWEAPTGKQLFFAKNAGLAHTVAGGGSLLAAASRTGRYLAVIYNTRGGGLTVRVMRIEEPIGVKEIPLSAEPDSVAISADGSRVATGNSDRTARVLDVTTGKEIASLTHDSPVWEVAFSADGLSLVTLQSVGDDESDFIYTQRIAHVWDIESQREVAQIDHEGEVATLAVDPEGDFVATTGLEDKTARLWSTENGSEVAWMAHAAPVRAVAFSLRGRYVASGGDDNVTRVWETKTSAELVMREHDGPVQVAAFSPDGKYLAYAGGTYEGEEGELSTGHRVHVVETATDTRVGGVRYGGPAQVAVFSPDGQYFASAGGLNGALVVKSPKSKQDEQEVEEGGAEDTSGGGGGDGRRNGKKVGVVASIDAQASVVSLAFSPDGKFLALAGAVYRDDSRGSLVWDMEAGRESFNVSHKGVANEIAFSPDGRYLAVACDDKAVLVWHARDGREALRLEHASEVKGLAFSPDGHYLAAAGGDNGATLWEFPSGRQVAVYKHTAAVNKVVFSPDGQYVATAGTDRTGALWEPLTGRRATSFIHDDEVTYISFSGDGKHVATASKDRTARVWEVPSGRQIVGIEHDDAINFVIFSPDGKYLATGGEDKTARVWFWRPEDLIQYACSRLTRNLTPEEWQQYLPEESYRKICPQLP